MLTLLPATPTLQALTLSLAPPPAHEFTAIAFQIAVRDGAGLPMPLTGPLSVRVTYDTGMLSKVAGDAQRLRLMRYTGSGGWVEVATTGDVTLRRVSGPVMQTGIFALVAERPTPALRTPDDRSSLSGLGPLLAWDIPPATTQVHLQVLPSGNDGPGINLIRNAESDYQVQPPRLGEGPYVMLPGMTYTWRVRTSTDNRALAESDPAWGPWSSRTFKTPAPSTAGLSVVQPAMGTVATSTRPVLVWTNTQSDTFYYEVQVSADPEFGPNDFRYWELRHGGATTPQNSYAVPEASPLAPGRTYYWRVRPRVQGDGTPVAWGPTWRFSTP